MNGYSLIRFSVWALPMGVLGFWGFTYTKACLNVLAAPGVPIEFSYKSKAGEVRLHASSYSVSLSEGQVRLYQPAVYVPKALVHSDLPVATADLITVRGLDAERGADQIVDVRVSNLKAVFVRLSSGKFPLQDLLPQRKGPPSTIPFHVVLNHAELLLADQGGFIPWGKRAVISQVEVSGVGDDWCAYGSGELVGMGSVKVRLQNVASQGLSIQASTPRIELASLLHHVVELPQMKAWRDIKASSLVASGPVAIYIPVHQKPVVQSQLAVVAKNFAYGDYRAAQATFQGIETAEGVSGKLVAQDGAIHATFDGSVDWTKTIDLAGQLDLKVPNAQSLPAWVTRYVPKSTSFDNADYHGWIAVRGKENYWLSGTVGAQGVQYQGHGLTQPNIAIWANRNAVAMNLQSGAFLNRQISGSLWVDTKGTALKGAVAANGVQIGDIASSLFHTTQVRGDGSINALLSGSPKKPLVQVLGQGRVAIHVPKANDLRFDAAQVEGVYEGGEFRIDRAYAQGPVGLVSVAGMATTTNGVNLDVTVRGAHPSALFSRATGSANLSAKVTGTLNEPKVLGRVEGYGVGYDDQTIPAVAANLVADRRSATLQDIISVRGTTQVKGSATYEFKSAYAHGDLQASNIQLAEWLGEDYVGLVDLPTVSFSSHGTDYSVQASALGRNLVAHGVKIDSLTASANAVPDLIRLVDSNVVVASGSIRARGQYDPSEQHGQGTVDLKDVPIEQIGADYLGRFAAAGRVSGRVTATAVGKKFQAHGEGQLDALSLNETSFGAGPWSTDVDSSRIAANISVAEVFGNTFRTLELNGLTYGFQDHHIGGDVFAHDVLAQDLLDAVLPAFPNLAPDQQTNLRSITGNLSLGAHLGGTTENADVTADTLEVANLTYNGEQLGNLNGTFARHDRTWHVKDLDLKGPVGQLDIGGDVEESGALNFNLTGDNIQVGKLSQMFPALTSRTGAASFVLTATGQTKSPQIEGSLFANNLFQTAMNPLTAAGTEAPTTDVSALKQGLSLDLYHISVHEAAQNGVELKGNYNYAGFTGEITGSSPFSLGMTALPEELAAKVTLNKRSIGQIAGLSDLLDPKRTTGDISGEITASLDQGSIALKGQLNLVADQIGLKIGPNPLGITQIDDTLRAVKAQVKFENGNLSADVSAGSSRGGTLDAQATTNLGDLSALLDEYRRVGQSALLRKPLQGTLGAQNLSFKQNAGRSGSFAARTTGAVTIGGTLRRPSLLGGITVADLETAVPQIQTTAGAAEAPIIDPTFDLAMSLSSPAKVHSSGADLTIVGGGSLQGSLSKPNASADFSVQSGNIRLPGGNVRVDQGGTVEFAYHNNMGTDSLATLGVDLRGRTTLSAQRYGDLTQRYDITLEVTGDLMKENGLTLQASSDPPDLSQDQILAMLGRTDILQSLGSTGPGDTQGRMREALVGFGLPMLFDPVTGAIAKGLGLEYLSVEYSALDQATLAVGKSFGTEFSFEGRRQLGEAPPGLRAIYDYRLVYAPRRLVRKVPRLSFSIGADQDRPWKLAAEYSIRVAGPRADAPSHKYILFK